MSGNADPTISAVSTEVYTFPTSEPEADGTLEWDATTAVSFGHSIDHCPGLLHE
jgi:hypothetical protein